MFPYCRQKDRKVVGELFVSKLSEAGEDRQYDVISGNNATPLYERKEEKHNIVSLLYACQRWDL